MSGSATSAYFAAILFVFAMAITMTAGDTPMNQAQAWFTGILWTAFHILLFPVVAALPAPNWAKASAYGWLVVDNAIVVAGINNAITPELTNGLRLGVHVAGAVWIAMAAVQGPNPFRAVGVLTAVFLGGYSLVAPYVGAGIFNIAGVLLFVWLALCGQHLSRMGPHDEERSAAPAT